MAQRKRFELPDEVPRPRDESYLDRVLGPAAPETEGVEGTKPAAGVVALESDQVGAAVGDVHRAPLVAVSSLQEQGAPAGTARDEAGPRLRAGQVGPPNGRSKAEAGKGVRKEAAAPSAPLPQAEKFAELEGRMSLVLRKSHLKTLRIVYENTVAKGASEYRVPGGQLASNATVTRRQISNVLLKLEGLGLIEKEEWRVGKQPKGFILRFTAF